MLRASDKELFEKRKKGEAKTKMKKVDDDRLQSSRCILKILNSILDEIGREKFDVDDNGSVSYLWRKTSLERT